MKKPSNEHWFLWFSGNIVKLLELFKTDSTDSVFFALLPSNHHWSWILLLYHSSLVQSRLLVDWGLSLSLNPCLIPVVFCLLALILLHRALLLSDNMVHHLPESHFRPFMLQDRSISFSTISSNEFRGFVPSSVIIFSFSLICSISLLCFR